MFEILQFCDVDSMQKNAAAMLAGRINSVLQKKAVAVLGICGGRNVAGVFSHLCRQNVPWSRVHIFLVDERCVPLESADSNFRLAYDSFLGDLVRDGLMSKDNLHPFISGEDIQADLDYYAGQLREYGGKFDAILLSIGEDGHIASLFPYHDSVRDGSSEFFISVENAPKPPAQRISASKKLLKKTDFSLLLAVGEEKAQALVSLSDEVFDEEDCPAKIVRSITCSYLLTDVALSGRHG